MKTVQRDHCITSRRVHEVGHDGAGQSNVREQDRDLLILATAALRLHTASFRSTLAENHICKRNRHSGCCGASPQNDWSEFLLPPSRVPASKLGECEDEPLSFPRNSKKAKCQGVRLECRVAGQTATRVPIGRVPRLIFFTLLGVSL